MLKRIKIYTSRINYETYKNSDVSCVTSYTIVSETTNEMLYVVPSKNGNYSRSQSARTKLDEPGRSRLLEEELLETGTWLLGLVAVELSKEWDMNVRNPVARRIVGLSCRDGWLLVCLA